MASRAARASVPFGPCAISGASMQATRMVLRLMPSVTERVSPSPTEKTLPRSASAVPAPIPARKPQSIPAANKALLALTGACTCRCCRRSSHRESRLGPCPALRCQPTVKQQPESKSGRKSSFSPKLPQDTMRIPRPSGLTALMSFTVIPVSICTHYLRRLHLAFKASAQEWDGRPASPKGAPVDLRVD